MQQLTSGVFAHIIKATRWHGETTELFGEVSGEFSGSSGEVQFHVIHCAWFIRLTEHNFVLWCFLLFQKTVQRHSEGKQNKNSSLTSSLV